jgi:hypothetical protein
MAETRTPLERTMEASARATGPGSDLADAVAHSVEKHGRADTGSCIVHPTLSRLPAREAEHDTSRAAVVNRWLSVNR